MYFDECFSNNNRVNNKNNEPIAIKASIHGGFTNQNYGKNNDDESSDKHILLVFTQVMKVSVTITESSTKIMNQLLLCLY